MRIDKSSGGMEEEGVNLMPLLDMVFLLLIFFLVATTIASEEREVEVELPGASSIQPISAPPPQLIINVLEGGSMTVSGQTVTDEQLSALLRKTATDDPNKEVLIRADLMSYHKHFASVARMCREAGIGEAKIGYILQKE
jgi:biopolymer transport protein ExbD